MQKISKKTIVRMAGLTAVVFVAVPALVFAASNQFSPSSPSSFSFSNASRTKGKFPAHSFAVSSSTAAFFNSLFHSKNSASSAMSSGTLLAMFAFSGVSGKVTATTSSGIFIQKITAIRKGGKMATSSVSVFVPVGHSTHILGKSGKSLAVGDEVTAFEKNIGGATTTQEVVVSMPFGHRIGNDKNNSSSSSSTSPVSRFSH